MKNTGKRFEEDFSKSVPRQHLIHRLPDAAQSFGGSSNLRFSRKNPFDYLLFDTEHRTLYALELKTVDKKSISFERTEDEEKEIHLHQIKGLQAWGQYSGVVAGFVIEFRPIENTIFIDISSFCKMMDLNEKKSFTINDIESLHLPYYVIPQTKKRTRCAYDVAAFLNMTYRLGEAPTTED